MESIFSITVGKIWSTKTSFKVGSGSNQISYARVRLVGFSKIGVGAWQIVPQPTCRRLRWWLHRRTGKKIESKRFFDVMLYPNYGLVKLVDPVKRSVL